LHKLRNTIAYHHPSAEELEAAFEDVPEDEDWAWYPSDTINNSFYLASDMLISAGILRATGETDTAKAFGKVMDAVVPVSNVMTDFVSVFDARHCYTPSGRECVKPAHRHWDKDCRCPEPLQGYDPVFHGERRRKNAALEVSESPASSDRARVNRAASASGGTDRKPLSIHAAQTPHWRSAPFIDLGKRRGSGNHHRGDPQRRGIECRLHQGRSA
jgi:hypothetical protein